MDSPDMEALREGDRVRIDIPDKTDPDHDQYHGEKGVIIDILEDDAGQYSGDERDSHIFTVRIDDDGTDHFRWRDLRPIETRPEPSDDKP